MKIKKGSKVTLSYEGKLDDGSVFDSSNHGDHDHPLVFTIGNREVILGFEKGVLDMEKEEEKDIIIEVNDAYGEINENLKQDIPRSVIPKEQEPKIGMILMMQTQDGQQVPLRIISVSNDKVSVDMNHPLAGKRLHFHVKILKIE